jgi:ribosomal protein L2
LYKTCFTPEKVQQIEPKNINRICYAPLLTPLGGSNHFLTNKEKISKYDIASSRVAQVCVANQQRPQRGKEAPKGEGGPKGGRLVYKTEARRMSGTSKQGPLLTPLSQRGVHSVGPEGNRYKNFQLQRSLDDERKAPFSYILACEGLNAGDELLNLNNNDAFESTNGDMNSIDQLYQKTGICLPIGLAPIGSIIHNIELHPGKGGKLARAAGTSAQLVQNLLPPTSSLLLRRTEVGSNPLPRLAKQEVCVANQKTTEGPIGSKGLRSNIENSFCTIRLPSGQQQLINAQCRVTIGIVSNIEHSSKNLKKAGRSRWLGFRPVVRGVAMNPIDHPHGGGEGRTKGGRPSVSPWGKPAKGQRGNRKLKLRK